MPDAARLAARSVSLAARRLGIARPAARARVQAAAAAAAARLQAPGHDTPAWLAAIISALSRQEETNTMADQENTVPAEAVYVTGTAETDAHLTALLDAEDAGDRVLLEAGPYTTLMLIAALRLAVSHPAMVPDIRAVLQAYADQWSGAYRGTPAQSLADNGHMPMPVGPPSWLN